MRNKFYIGNYKNDAKTGPYRQWLVGKFVKNGPRKTDKVEIKYWELKSGLTRHKTKISGTLECTFILDGLIEGEINGRKIKLKKDQYIIIKPGTPNNIVKFVKSDARGLTIKSPSVPTAKKIIN